MSDMKLTKPQREVLKGKFGGKCAYCGTELNKGWHADHLEAVVRNHKWVSGKGFVADGTCARPENDNFENLMPSCAPCNIDKHSMSLEGWRVKLSRSLEVLQKNCSTYRHAKRFGLLEDTPKPIVFYFETYKAESSVGNG